MQKINGDANVLAVKVAAESGVERFVYISSIQSTLPPFVLKGLVLAWLMSLNQIHYSVRVTFFVKVPSYRLLNILSCRLDISRERGKQKMQCTAALRRKDSS